MEQLTAIQIKKLTRLYEFAEEMQKPLVMTEVGFPANHNALSKPYAWPEHSNDRDDKLQASAYSALYESFKAAGFPHGIFIWKYATTLDSYERFDNERGFNPFKKPAEKVIKKILQGI